MILHALALALLLTGTAKEAEAPAAPPVRTVTPPVAAPANPRVTIFGGGGLPPGVLMQQSQGGIQIMMPESVDTPPLSQRTSAPLTPAQMVSLRMARALRNDGKLDAARDTLLRLNQRVPHQTNVLSEMARVYGAQNDWASVERLARSERASQRDTLLLGRDLALAFERLHKHREAAVVVIECWRLRPVDSDWASQSLSRLAMNDSKGVREVMHKAATDNPDRIDFLSAAAGLDWKMGDGAAALKALTAADSPGLTPPLRWRFADVLLSSGAERDSLGAVDALLGMISDPRYDASYRMQAARRAMDVYDARGTAKAGAPQVYAALKDVPPARWNAELLVDVARALREAGQTTAARTLLDTPAGAGPAKPGIALERALDDLHEGPPQKALPTLQGIAESSPEARFRFAEALFFAGMADSALAEYKRASADPEAPFAGAAFDRMYLIEDTSPKSLLPAVGHLMYLDWRGDARAALTFADSLAASMQHGPLWARLAIFRGQRHETLGEPEAALVPVLELATQLPDDRLAPVAREMAGDIYLYKLKKQPEALAQYEECLTRYPRAWNSAEVRRRLEALKKGRL